MVKKDNDYKITVLEGLEGVRKTVGMYVGDVDGGSGLHHLLREIIDNSVDEYLEGYCNKIIVILHKDGSAEISDNGRGIPVYYMKDKKMTALEAVFMNLHAGGKFDKSNYEHSAGINGVGAAVVNALSDKLKVIVRRDEQECSIVFSKGKKIEDFISKLYKGKSGTTVRFVPDPTIFTKSVEFDSEIVRNRLRDLSFLCNGLTIQFIDEIRKTNEEFDKDDGMSEFVRYLAEGNKLIDEPIVFSNKKDNILVNVALQWIEDNLEYENCRAYANNILNTDGGTHMIGFKSGLTRTVNNYINNADLPKTLKISLSGDDVREGLVGIVSIRHPNPKFNSQDKVKLVCDDARQAVEGVVSENLMSYFEQNPVIAKKIIIRAINAFKAREASRKAREAIRKTAICDGGGVLPGKLADCSSKDPEKCELFICEGASAGGGMKMGRNREFQAVLPLRGKVLNIEKADYQKILKNEELMNIITVIGIGVGKNIDMENLRYSKIILATDADVDGSHIRCLLLTFLFRQMPQLLLNGHIYVAQPPLFRVDYRSNIFYLKDEQALKNFIEEKKIQKNNLKINRFKGLGEMNPDQLAETTMDPEKRVLLQIQIANHLEADRIFNILMGDEVEPRKEFIIKSAKFAKLDV